MDRKNEMFYVNAVIARGGSSSRSTIGGRVCSAVSKATTTTWLDNDESLDEQIRRGGQQRHSGRPAAFSPAQVPALIAYAM